VKVLRLALSHDLRADIPEEERQYMVAQRVLAEATGETWETALRPIWPSEKLPGLVDRWVGEERPDLVMVNLAAYWVSFASVALKVERRWPGGARRLGPVARCAAETRIAAHSPLTEFARDIATRLVGVEYYFEPDATVALFETIIRRLLQSERLAVAVRGPALIPQRSSRAILNEREARFWAWHDGMRDVCERLHVAFLPYDAELEAPDSGVRMAGDTAHYTLEGTRLHGLREGELMVRAWRQAQGATG